MPKPVKKAARKRPSADPNLRVHQMMAKHMAKAEEELDSAVLPEIIDASVRSFRKQLSAHMAKLGTKGGKISGAKRMDNLSATKRKQIAKKAAAARWAKRPKN